MSSLIGHGSGPPAGVQTDGLGDPLPPQAVQRLGTTRMSYPVGAVAFRYLPGDRAVVANESRLEVLDLARGTCLSRHAFAPSSLTGLACDNEGRQAALITREGEVILWSLDAGREIRRWQTGQASLSHVCISPDGQRVLTTGRIPATLKEWDLATGRERIAIAGPEVSFFLHVYNKAEGASAADGTTIPTPVQFSMGIYGPDGATALVGDTAQASLLHYDLRTGRLIHQWYPDIYTNRLALSSDGQRLLIGSRHRATEWALDGYRFLNVFDGHHGHEATAVAYGTDPRQILTGSRDGSIRLWNRLDGTVTLRWVAHQRYVAALAVSSDGKRCLSFGAGALVESDLKTGGPRLAWDRHQAPVLAAAWLPAGERLVSSSADGTIRLWNTATGRTECQFPLPPQGLAGHALAISPDGAHLAVGGYCNVWEFALDNGVLQRTLKGHRGFVRALAYAADGQRLLSSADDGAILVWPHQAVEPCARLEGHRGGVLALAIAPDAKEALSGGRDGTVRLWNLQTHQLAKICQGHEGWVEAVAFAADHRQGLSAGRDGLIRQWSLDSGALAGTLNHGQEVDALAYSSADKVLYSAGKDGRIVAWNLPARRELAALPGHTQGIRALALSPDGKQLTSASQDNTLLIWQMVACQAPADPR